MTSSCVLLTSLVLLVAAASVSSQTDLLDKFCVGCICEGASKCDRESGCVNGYCGPFRISQPYFQDGKPDGNKDYTTCSQDLQCAASVVRNYMRRYGRDCDQDGSVTCADLAMIHQAGPSGCVNKEAVQATEFYKRFSACAQNFQLL